eukprot:102082_1
MGGCAMICCCDNADERISQKAEVTESTPFGKTGKSGTATKDAYIEKYKLTANKCIQGSATSDEDLCEFMQQHISTPDLECLVVISAAAAKAYRLPNDEATTTGIMILEQIVLANKESLKIFHLNGQRLDWNRAANVNEGLSQCTQLELV